MKGLEPIQSAIQAVVKETASNLKYVDDSKFDSATWMKVIDKFYKVYDELVKVEHPKHLAYKQELEALKKAADAFSEAHFG